MKKRMTLLAIGNCPSFIMAFGSQGSLPLFLQERKTLLKGNFREQHWNYGSLLLALGVGLAIEGPLNTWFRTGGSPSTPIQWCISTQINTGALPNTWIECAEGFTLFFGVTWDVWDISQLMVIVQR
jgi:hypothetical protein